MLTRPARTHVSHSGRWLPLQRIAVLAFISVVPPVMAIMVSKVPFPSLGALVRITLGYIPESRIVWS
jgi:hypothetical protein